MSERIFADAFAKWLRSQGLHFIRARCDRRSTIAEGWCDVTIVHPRLPALLVELKDGKKGTLSAAQKRNHAELAAAGITVHVCRDLQSAVELVQAWRGWRCPEDAAHIMRAVAPEETLARFGGAVMRKDGPNRWTQIRTATAADAHLPVLVP